MDECNVFQEPQNYSILLQKIDIKKSTITKKYIKSCEGTNSRQYFSENTKFNYKNCF